MTSTSQASAVGSEASVAWVMTDACGCELSSDGNLTDQPTRHAFDSSVPPSRTSNPDTSRGSVEWTTQLGTRLRRYLWLKVPGISLFIWAFMVAYFYLLRHPASPPFVMPLTPLDLVVPFQPGAFPIYVSLWIYVGIPPGLLLGFRELIAYGLWAAGMCLVGLACFYFLPTSVPAFALDPELASHPAIALLQGVDAAGNACPSMHVASATFSALWLHHLLRGMGAPRWLPVLNIAWLLLIVLSTLAVRQLVVLDVLAGALLGLTFAWAALRWRPALPQSVGAETSWIWP